MIPHGVAGNLPQLIYRFPVVFRAKRPNNWYFQASSARNTTNLVYLLETWCGKFIQLSPMWRSPCSCQGKPLLPPCSILQNQGKTGVLPVLPPMAPLVVSDSLWATVVAVSETENGYTPSLTETKVINIKCLINISGKIVLIFWLDKIPTFQSPAFKFKWYNM